MFSFIRNSVLSALICLGGLSFTSTIASAQTLELELGQGNPGLRVRLDCRGRDRHDSRCRTYREQERRDYRRDERYSGGVRRDNRGPRFCTPERALDKAERMGVRRARTVDAGRRTIDVAGRVDGRRVVVTFGRERDCPVFR